jgi:hypothetical protein
LEIRFIGWWWAKMSIIPSIYNTIKKEVYNVAAFINGGLLDKIQRNESVSFLNSNCEKGLSLIGDNRGRTEGVSFLNGNSQIGLNAIGENRGRTESVTFVNS